MRLCGLGSLTSASYSFGWKSGFQTRLHVLNKKEKKKKILPQCWIEKRNELLGKGGERLLEWLLRSWFGLSRSLLQGGKRRKRRERREGCLQLSFAASPGPTQAYFPSRSPQERTFLEKSLGPAGLTSGKGN